MSSIKTSSRIAAISLALAAGLLAMAPEAVFAQSGTWNFSGGTGRSWSDTANWESGVIASGSGNTATFASSSSGTTVLDTYITIGSIAHNNNNVRVIEGAGVTLTLETTAGSTPSLSATTGATLGITSAIAGTQGFSKTGAGTLSFWVAQTHLPAPLLSRPAQLTSKIRVRSVPRAPATKQ